MITIICLISCNNEPAKKNNDTTRSSTVDSAVEAQKATLIKNYTTRAEHFNMLPITKGVDSFELRLWVSSMFRDQDLLVLSYNNGDWHSNKIKYFTGGDFSSSTQEKINPDISAAALADSLKLIDLNSLISQNEIKGFKGMIADGVSYNFEIATKNNYRLLMYRCPELFTDAYNKKVAALIHLLDKHFHFWKPICGAPNNDK
jgi:hypothetical protein